jgi:hypothetical protein
MTELHNRNGECKELPVLEIFQSLKKPDTNTLTRDTIAESMPENIFSGNIPVSITFNTVKKHGSGQFYCV